MISQILLYIIIPAVLGFFCLKFPIEKWIPDVSQKKASLFVGIAIAIFVTATTIMAILKLYALSTKGFDLGIWEHYLYRMSQDGIKLKNLWCRPLYIIFLPFYMLGGLPLLFFIQSFVIGLSAWIVYRFSLVAFSQVNLALIAALAYLLYYPIWYLPLNDFHSDCVFPLLFGILFYLEYTEKRSSILLWIVTGVLFAAKEITPFILMPYYLTLFLKTRHKNYLYLSVISLLVISIGFAINPSAGFPFSSIQPIVLKFFYFFCLFICWGFFSFTSPIYLTPILFPAAFTIFSGAHSYFNIGYHYQIMYSTPIVFSSIAGLANIPQWLQSFSFKFNKSKNILLILLLNLYFHGLLGPTPLSRQFWLSSMHSTNHYSRIFPTERDNKIVEIIQKEFPENKYRVSVQNGIYFSNLGRQKEYTIFPFKLENADRVIIDRTLEPEVGDSINEEEYQYTVKASMKKFQLLFGFKGFEIWERNVRNQ